MENQLTLLPYSELSFNCQFLSHKLLVCFHFFIFNRIPNYSYYSTSGGFCLALGQVTLLLQASVDF